jgi:hypothetical protein
VRCEEWTSSIGSSPRPEISPESRIEMSAPGGRAMRTRMKRIIGDEMQQHAETRKEVRETNKNKSKNKAKAKAKKNKQKERKTS